MSENLHIFLFFKKMHIYMYTDMHTYESKQNHSKVHRTKLAMCKGMGLK